MANGKRNIQMNFWVTEEEKDLINQKMKLLPTQRYGVYRRKMATDGFIIYWNTENIKAFTTELTAISRNINQITKWGNAGGPIYKEDIQHIQKK